MAESFLLYGESGCYKSSQLGVFAEYETSLYDEPDMHVRLVSGDSTWKPLSHLIKFENGKHVGRVRPWSIKAPHPQKLAIISAASQGYWPNVIDEYGIADYSKGMTLHFENVAGYGWEGLTEVSDIMMQHLVDSRRDTGQKIHSTFEEKLPGVKESFQYGGASQSTYGFVQKETRKYVKTLAALPVHRVVCTAHEGKGEDSQKRLVFGPSIAGKASNDKVSGWFGVTLHHESYMTYQKRVNAKGESVSVVAPAVRAFFQRHPDPEIPNIFWPAKLDCVPELMVRLWERYPESYIPLRLDPKTGKCAEGINTLLAFMDEEMGEEEAR